METAVEGVYPCDLSDHEWEFIKELLPRQSRRGRPQVTSLRGVVGAVLYMIRSGCAWRYLPKEYPPWKTVYWYFSKWRDAGVWERIHHALAAKVRRREGRQEAPQVVIIDSQSVRAASGEELGWDGFKKVRGRKRQIIVDSLGLIWAAHVHNARVSENTRADEAIMEYPTSFPTPKVLLGDGSYGKPPFDQWVKFHWGIWPTIRRGKKKEFRDKEKGWRVRMKVVRSNLKPQRWIVERSFAWFNHSRRLARDYEHKTKTSQAMIYISQIPMMLRRLCV